MRRHHQILIGPAAKSFYKLLTHNETWKFVQAKSKQAAPLAPEDDMRWNPNDDAGIYFNP